MKNAPLVRHAITNHRKTSAFLHNWLLTLAALVALSSGSTVVRAQELVGDADWAIFVSQRSGATELYLLDISTRQVSQLTETGRAHLTPAVANGAKMLAYASREGSSYEIFTAQLNSSWRTRRPLLAAVNRLTYNPIDEVSPSISGDGAKVTFASEKGIEIMSGVGDSRRVLVGRTANSFDYAPAISPDGSQVAFVSNRGGSNEIWLVATQTGQTRQLTRGGAALGGISWSADSSRIVFTTSATASKLSGIAMSDIADGSFRVLTEGNDGEAAISPGGMYVLFTSLRDGDPELYMLSLRTGSVQRLTSNPGVDGSAVFVNLPSAPIRRMPAPGRGVQSDKE
ncbi:MAG: TolB family protein [Blastocatellia bacterium]